MNNNLETMRGFLSDEKHEELKERGYILKSEHQPFGFWPIYMNHKTNDILFVRNNHELDRKCVYHYLCEFWAPVSDEEILWKQYQMKSWFGLNL